MRTLFRKSFGSADSQSKLMWSESCKASASTGSDSNATDWLSFDPKEEQSDGTTDKSSKSTKADSSGTFDRNHRRHQCAFDVNNDRAFRRRFERITWQVLEGHTSDVNGVEFVGNRLLISCSNDKTVRVWRQNADERFAEAESSSTQPVQSPLNGHAYGVNAVRVSPFGTILTSASTDGRVILWSTQDGTQSAVLSQPSEGAVRCLSFSPSSALLASGGDDESVCLWDLSSRALLRCLTGPEAMIACVAFSPDSQLLVAGSSGGELWFWHAQGVHLGERAAVIQAAHDLGVLSLDFAPDSELVASLAGSSSETVRPMLLVTCGNDDLVRLWIVSVQNGLIDGRVQVRKLRDLRGHTSNVNCCRFSSDGRLIASASGDKSVILWSVSTGQLLTRLQAHQRYVTCVAFSADNRLLASGSNDRQVIVWALDQQSFKYQPNSTDGSEINSGDTLLSGSTVFERSKPYERVSDTSHWQADDGNDLMQWSIDQVLQWLATIGVEELQDIFRQQQIDGPKLLHLTHDTLQHVLKIESINLRNHVLRSIQSVRNPLWQQLSSNNDWSLGHVLPDELICPITHEQMRDPVVAQDGYSYERAAIEKWFSDGNRTSPMTNAPLTSEQLIANYNLKTLIRKYVAL